MQEPIACSDWITFKVQALVGATLGSDVDSIAQIEFLKDDDDEEEDEAASHAKPIELTGPQAVPPPNTTALCGVRLQLPDAGLTLGAQGADALDVDLQQAAADLEKLRARFLEVCQPLLPDTKLAQRKGFQAFLQAVLRRRRQHVESWVDKNTISFPKDPEALLVKVRH